MANNVSTIRSKQVNFSSNKQYDTLSNQILIFPFVMRSGFVYVNEKGFIQDFENSGTIQKVFPGKNPIIMVWEDSTTLEKPININEYDYKFKVGKYYSGTILEHVSNTEIQESDTNKGFKGVEFSESIKIQYIFPKKGTNTNSTTLPFHVLDEDHFKFYVVEKNKNNSPYVSKNWMYISSCQNIYDGATLIGQEVIFSTLNDKVSVSGRAIEQYPQYGAIGEPFAFPRIVNDVNKTVVLDTTYSQYDKKKLCKYLQVEFQGPCLLGCITVLGRTITKQNDGTIRTSLGKFLLMSNFNSVSANELNKTSIPTRNFYCISGASLTDKYGQEWLTRIKNIDDAVSQIDFGGVIQLGQASDYSFDDKFINYHKSNMPSSNANNKFWDYEDLDWRPLSYLENDLTFDTSMNFYSENELSLTAQDDLIQILNTNSFIYMNQLQLDVNMFSTRPVKMSSIPILKHLTFFGDWTISSNKRNRKLYNLTLLGSCTDINIAINTINQSNDVYIPLNTFAGKENALKYISSSTSNTTLCFGLTDKIYLPNRDNNNTLELYDTKYLGQSKNEAGNYIFTDHKPLLYSNQAGHYTSNEGFIIDKIVIQSIFSGNIRVSGYNNFIRPNSESIWAMTVMSNSLFTGNFRDWTTIIDNGNWPDKYIIENDEFTWPDSPNKNIQQNEVQLNIQDNLTYDLSGKEIAVHFDIHEDAEDFEFTDLNYFKENVVNKIGIDLQSQNNFGNLQHLDFTQNGKTMRFLYVKRDIDIGYIDISYESMGVDGVNNQSTYQQHIDSLHFTFDVNKTGIKVIANKDWYSIRKNQEIYSTTNQGTISEGFDMKEENFMVLAKTICVGELCCDYEDTNDFLHGTEFISSLIYPLDISDKTEYLLGGCNVGTVYFNSSQRSYPDRYYFTKSYKVIYDNLATRSIRDGIGWSRYWRGWVRGNGRNANGGFPAFYKIIEIRRVHITGGIRLHFTCQDVIARTNGLYNYENASTFFDGFNNDDVDGTYMEQIIKLDNDYYGINKSFVLSPSYNQGNSGLYDFTDDISCKLIMDVKINSVIFNTK